MSAMLGRVALLLLFALLPALGCQGSARQFFGRNGFVAGMLPPRSPELVELHFGEDRPRCNVLEIGIVVYDAGRDLRTTTISVAVEGIREHAAELGASGVYQIRREAGPTSGVGTAVFGVAAVSSTQEVGLMGMAYVCREELVGGAPPTPGTSGAQLP